MPLTVLTLNLWHNNGPWQQRRQRIRTWIERLQPDLIAFQEVLRALNGSLDLAAEVTDRLGYHVAFGRSVTYWNDPALAFGNAIAGRWPLTDPETIALPHLDSGEFRSALSVTVASPFGPLSFTTTHLNWKFDHGFIRERQVVAVADLVRRRRPPEGFPPILAGDFNAEPDSDEIRYLTGRHSIDGRSVAFHDAWQRVGDRGVDPSTWSNRNPYAAATFDPDRRIDYIFTGAPRPDGTGRLLACRIVCNDAEDGVWPTDHFGLLAELATEPAGAPAPAAPATPPGDRV